MLLELIMGFSLNTGFSNQCAPPDVSVKPDVVGIATAPDSNEILYREEYFYDYCDDQDLVLYKKADDEILTWKLISDSGKGAAPVIEQFDIRHGQYIKTDWEAGKILLRYRKNREAELIESFLVPSQEQVIDAGFDQYVRDNWLNLVNYEKKKFSFASPSHQQNLGLRIFRMNEDMCRSVIDNVDEYICFETEASNFIYRMLSQPIKLVYNLEKRLVKFLGVTNILDNNGKNYFAEIDYQYFN